MDQKKPIEEDIWNNQRHKRIRLTPSEEGLFSTLSLLDGSFSFTIANNPLGYSDLIFLIPLHFLLNGWRRVLNDFYMYEWFSLQKYFCNRHMQHVLTAKVMGTRMHALKYYKKWKHFEKESNSCVVYLSSPTFLPGLPWPPWSPFSPRHLQTTLQHFLSATVPWKMTRNISFMYINHKTKTDFFPFCLYHGRTYKISLQDVCNLCKPNTQRFIVFKPSAKLYFLKFHQVLCVVQAN